MSPKHTADEDGSVELELRALSVPPPDDQLTVTVLKPKTLPKLVALFGVSLVLMASTAYSASWLGYQQANRNTKAQIAELNADLASRRAARAESDQRTAQQQDTLRRYACALAKAAPSPDAEIRQMRTDLGCDALPPAPPARVAGVTGDQPGRSWIHNSSTGPRRPARPAAPGDGRQHPDRDAPARPAPAQAQTDQHRAQPAAGEQRPGHRVRRPAAARQGLRLTHLTGREYRHGQARRR
jgi:hypothetical protein